MGFLSNIQNILIKKGDFGGVKTHDLHTFIKVISSLYYISLLVCIFWKQIIIICFLLQYVLPLSLPDDFDNNIKQIIYVLGKYMR